MAAGLFFSQEPGVMVTGIFGKYGLYVCFTWMPDTFNVWCVYVPISACPDSHVIDNTVRAVLNIRIIVSALAVKVKACFKYPTVSWGKCSINVNVGNIQVLTGDIAILMLLRYRHPCSIGVAISSLSNVIIGLIASTQKVSLVVCTA